MALTTTIHSYRFDTSDPAQAKAWSELKAKLQKTNGECFETWGNGSHYNPKSYEGQIELETAHIFDNQWNSNKGRIFDWAMDFQPYNKKIKQGHYIDITQEIRDLRDNTASCGHCGKQEPIGKYDFCPHCIGSPHLTAESLKLTRMEAVSTKRDYRELTSDEKAKLMPLFVDAQTKGNTEREKAAIVKAREDVIKKRDKGIKSHTVEADGMLWLLDNGLRIDNVIYYSHTDKFSFGWKTPLSGELLSRTLDLISEFPFSYEIKTTEGVKA